MVVIKEQLIIRNVRYCVLRGNEHDRSIAYFNALFLEARDDFPALKGEDCVVVRFGSEWLAGCWGVMLTADESDVKSLVRYAVTEPDKLNIQWM